eukprot:Blabericola_migrator_1__11938@NODE_72_length_15243_cov_214_481220_g65_i0_p9_GENE_NODE_72_length_15243_cov_214_481220_g65_i0NODE_72_length_15243_cov_214_481220_g65_i0_p9_ORF_typecomplete_len187_score31_98_NODE_72_length_15243_cov_214_481220_g65_i070527612
MSMSSSVQEDEFMDPDAKEDSKETPATTVPSVDANSKSSPDFVAAISGLPSHGASSALPSVPERSIPYSLSDSFSPLSSTRGAAAEQDTTTAMVDDPDNCTTHVPRIGEVLWCIDDFVAFRNAAKGSSLPPLRSPEIESGIHLLLWPHWGGHIRGKLNIPDALRQMDATYCVSVTCMTPPSDSESE